MSDMEHMKHIDNVAADDCAMLRYKESTYKASWKAAGGRSAWFMARRNMDRLINMLAQPERPEHFRVSIADTPAFTDKDYSFLMKSYVAEDIFAKIEEKPGGEDGTVLACLRDLRRYFTLIEAEMVARGVVSREIVKGYDRPVLDMNANHLEFNDVMLTDIDVTIRMARNFSGSATYVFPECKTVMLGSENGNLTINIDCETNDPKVDVKSVEIKTTHVDINGPIVMGDTIHDTRGTRPAFVIDSYGNNIRVNDFCNWTNPNGQVIRAKLTDIVNPEVGRIVTEFGTLEVDLETLHSVHAEAEAKRATRITPEAGSQHASVTPWQIDKDYKARIIERIGTLLFEACWRQVTGNVFRLLPVVESYTIPKEVAHCYTMLDSKGSTWILKRQSLPAELDADYPRLQVEMNAFEFEGSPKEYWPMYAQVGEKHILRDEYRVWARDA
jgi:hypothetical protein